MTKLEAIRGEIASRVLKQRLTGIAHEKQTLANIAWLVETVDEFANEMCYWHGIIHETCDDNHPRGCGFKRVLARLEEPDA